MTDGTDARGDMAHLAAVVLNWRDAEQTTGCVADLLVEPLIDRIYIIDNESSGDLRAFVAEAGSRVTLIEVEQNLGFSAGMNIGLRAALDSGAAYVLAQNNDARMSPGALASLRRCLESDQGLIAVGPVTLDDAGGPVSTGGTFKPALLRARDDSRGGEPHFLTWASVLLRCRGLRDVGLLDERFFMYWEDVEFGLRARSRGWRLAVDPAATVTHQGGGSHAAAGPAIIEYSTYGAVVLARLLPGPLPKLGAVYRVIRRVLGHAVSGDPRRAVAALRGAANAVGTLRPGRERYPRGSRWIRKQPLA